MHIKVVTDSTSDLPVWVAEKLGITVIPAYLHFGDKTYRDRLDMGEDEFYERLASGEAYPTTEPPTPQDFATTYKSLSTEADGIVSIHISGKLSATCNSALRGKEIADVLCPIEIIDSRFVSMGLGLVAMTAGSAAMSGKDLAEVLAEVHRTIPRVQMFGLFDTLKYLAMGGRVGKAKALLASALNVKPLLTMIDGEVESVGQVRSRSGGLDKLVDFVQKASNVQNVAVIYSTLHDEAQSLAERLSLIVDKDRIMMVRLGPVLGVHGGTGSLFIALSWQ